MVGGEDAVTLGAWDVFRNTEENRREVVDDDYKICNIVERLDIKILISFKHYR